MACKYLWPCCLLLCLTQTVTPSYIGDYHPHLERNSKVADEYQAQDENYWKNKAREELEKSLQDFDNVNTNIAKNIIIFIGDGMSLPTVVASRIYKAQLNNATDAEGNLLSFEKFPNVGLSKTYGVDRQTPDSASTASAIYSGVKTNYHTLGFDNSIILSNAASQDEANKVETILKWAQDQGKSTGLVTTARVTHATPAALYAHIADRGWECDREMNQADGGNKTKEGDITRQMVEQEPGKNLNVVLGGGLNSFCPNNTEAAKHTACKRATELKTKTSEADLEKLYPDHAYWDCTRDDERDLVAEFLDKENAMFVSTKDELNQVNPDNVDTLLGLFSESFMAYEDERLESCKNASTCLEPSLSEMTTTAISILKKNSNGFFLMVEGSNIDHSHHNSRAAQALLETVEFDNAIEAALKEVDTKDTLIIVTADHGHTMSISGYQERGQDIIGVVGNTKADDNTDFMILNYGNGEGFDQITTEVDENGTCFVVRKDPKNDPDYKSYGFKHPSPVPIGSESHGGDDVGIYAIGPYSHLFKSVHEQSYIAFVMSYSACIGPYKDDTHCISNPPSSATNTTLSVAIFLSFILIAILQSVSIS